MKPCLLLCLTLAVCSASQLKLNAANGGTAVISFESGILTVPQHCRADTCSINALAIKELQVLASSQAAALAAQQQENIAMRALVKAVTGRLASLEGDHAADTSASEAADAALAAADETLAAAVAAVTKMTGPKGDKGAKGDTGATGAAGADGKDGKDGETGENPAEKAEKAAALAQLEAERAVERRQAAQYEKDSKSSIESNGKNIANEQRSKERTAKANAYSRSQRGK